MRITVPLVVEIATDATLEHIEQQVLDAGRAAMRQAFEAVVVAIDQQPGPCPGCGSPDRRRDGSASRVIQTSFGRVALCLRRVRCRACGRRQRPSAALLVPLGTANTTARLRQACVLAGSSWPFATAARVLADLCGATVSAEQVRLVTVASGAKAAARQRQAATELVTPSAEQARAARSAATERTRHGSRPRPEPPPPARLVVGLDGGWVASRDQPGGMEGKVGVVATGQVALGPDRCRLTPRRYVATFAPARHLGELTYAAAEALRGTSATRQVVVGDGAEWIKQQAAHHFPTALTILDWPHLWRVMRRAIRAVRPGRRQRASRRDLSRTISAALWAGEVDEAHDRMLAVRGTGEPVEALEDAIRYLTTQRAWLGNDQAWQHHGYPVGSGLVERAVALIINRRMKRQGMRWTRASADAIVALRVEQRNHDWDAGTNDLIAA